MFFPDWLIFRYPNMFHWSCLRMNGKQIYKYTKWVTQNRSAKLVTCEMTKTPPASNGSSDLSKQWQEMTTSPLMLGEWRDAFVWSHECGDIPLLSTCSRCIKYAIHISSGGWIALNTLMKWLDYMQQRIPCILYTHYEIMAHKSNMTQPNEGSFTRHQSQDFVEWLALWRHAALPPLLTQTRAVRRYALTNPHTILIQRDKLAVQNIEKQHFPTSTHHNSRLNSFFSWTQVHGHQTQWDWSSDFYNNWRQFFPRTGDKQLRPGIKPSPKRKVANKLKELRRKHESCFFVLEGFIGYMEDLVEFHLDGFRMKRNALWCFEPPKKQARWGRGPFGISCFVSLLKLMNFFRQED